MFIYYTLHHIVVSQTTLSIAEPTVCVIQQIVHTNIFIEHSQKLWYDSRFSLVHVFVVKIKLLQSYFFLLRMWLVYNVSQISTDNKQLSHRLIREKAKQAIQLHWVHT